MNRRDFVKIASGAFLMSTIPLLKTVGAAENKTDKKRLVFYFTGSGNSLFVARELSENIISIPQALKSEKLNFTADEIGVVYPVYWGQPPQMVKRFLQKATLDAPYKFAIATYGMVPNATQDILNNIAEKKGISFDYIATLQMVDNYLPAFDMNDEIKKDKHEQQNLIKIKQDLAERRKWHEPVSLSDKKRRESFEAGGVIPFPVNSEDILTVTDACVGCGLCTKVCPRKNFKIVNGRAVNNGDCEYCLACAHACPHKAIIMKQGEKNPKARYRHKNVSLSDIIQANN